MSQKTKVLILTPDSNTSSIDREYHTYLVNICEPSYLPIPPYLQTKKAKAADMRLWYESLNTKDYDYVGITVANVFKAIHGQCKPEREIGYIYKPYFYLPSYKKIFFNPEETRSQIKYALEALKSHVLGTYADPGSTVIHGSEYPRSIEQIRTFLTKLEKYDALTCDIETFSLKHPTSGIRSIAFAWDMHNGGSFLIDASIDNRNQEVRVTLKDFFIKYKGKLIFHNISFDAYILTYQLFMNSLTDYEGMYEGINTLLKNFDDTMIITYLATNNCSGNHLSLKDQSQEFAGNYAEENIGTIESIPVDELLKYNLTDVLATWYVYHKHYNTMIKDSQGDLYEGLFKDTLKDIIRMQLTGLPINLEKVKEARVKLEKAQDDALTILKSSSLIQDFIDYYLVPKELKIRNSKLKTKQLTEKDIHVEFNPKSNLQLKELFYEYLEMPVINLTKTNVPSTDAKTLEALKNHTEEPEIKDIIQALLDYADADKMLSTFIPAFEQASYDPNTNWHYLFGSFHLGGTVSGRLSSSNINLQNLPATGATYAKLIKSCFSAPKGWLFVGLDFASLTARRAI